MSKKCVQKAFGFDESKCKSIGDINQDTPISSASQFKEPGSKRKVIVENKIPSARFFSKSVFQNISLLWGLLGSFA